MSEFASTPYKSHAGYIRDDASRDIIHTCIRKEIVTFGRAARGHYDLHKGRRDARVAREALLVRVARGGRKEVFARAYSLITGGIAMRGTRLRKT